VCVMCAMMCAMMCAKGVWCNNNIFYLKYTTHMLHTHVTHTCHTHMSHTHVTHTQTLMHYRFDGLCFHFREINGLILFLVKFSDDCSVCVCVCVCVCVYACVGGVCIDRCYNVYKLLEDTYTHTYTHTHTYTFNER